MNVLKKKDEFKGGFLQDIEETYDDSSESKINQP